MGLRTPLYAWHVAQGARIIDFGGWDMPVVYSTITAEHQAARRAAGLFDICHMGRFRFEGPDALVWLDRLLTNRVDDLRLGQVRYSLVLNEAGGILDDVLVTRLESGYLLVVNASNRQKLAQWFASHRGDLKATMEDWTEPWGMIAVQGPRAVELTGRVLGASAEGLRRYFAMETAIAGRPAILSRTGYTGEDGVELIVPAPQVVGLCERLLAMGQESGLRPAGLGARDTLRLEAGMPLYGHEITEQTDPIQAGLGWAVKSQDKEFVGKGALAKADPARPVRVGLRLADKRIARQGFEVLHSGRVAGTVTSGTFAPTLEASVAMAYVPPALARAGVELAVRIRSEPVPATVVPLPFYQRGKA